MPARKPFWKPYRKRKYNLVDLGCGANPRRLLRLSQKHSEKKFLGIDSSSELGKPRSGAGRIPSNLVLQRADALQALRLLPSESVSQINADYFFQKVIDRERYYPILAEAKRVLAPNGRIMITQDAVHAPIIIRALQRLGFRVIARAIRLERAKGLPTETLEKMAEYAGKFKRTFLEAEKERSFLTEKIIAQEIAGETEKYSRGVINKESYDYLSRLPEALRKKDIPKLLKLTTIAYRISARVA